jgi:hypothetical protein
VCIGQEGIFEIFELVYQKKALFAMGDANFLAEISQSMLLKTINYFLQAERELFNKTV